MTAVLWVRVTGICCRYEQPTSLIVELAINGSDWISDSGSVSGYVIYNIEVKTAACINDRFQLVYMDLLAYAKFETLDC